MIVFTSDHGELGGTHSLHGKQACSYDEAIHVPLFVRVPWAPANQQRTQMVSSVDFFGLIAGTSSSGGPITHGSTTTIYITGGNVQPGPTVQITNPSGDQLSPIPLDDSEVVTGAFAVPASFTVGGAYMLVVTNSSGLPSTSFGFTVL